MTRSQPTWKPLPSVQIRRRTESGCMNLAWYARVPHYELSRGMIRGVCSVENKLKTSQMLKKLGRQHVAVVESKLKPVKDGSQGQDSTSFRHFLVLQAT